jgi:hypothetical protein
MKLVSNWRDGKRWISAHCMGAASSLVGAYAAVPADWREKVPPEWLLYACGVLTALGFVGRFLDQSKGDSNADDAR